MSDDYSTYNEEDLLVILQFKDDSPEDAKTAGLELYLRFNEKLLAACIRKLDYHKSDTGHAADIIYNTWWRVKDKPQNYIPSLARGKTPEEKVFRFIRGIMIHEYANWFNGRGLLDKTEEDFHIVYNLDDDTKYTDVRLAKLKEIEVESGRALTGLSEAEQAIFFTYLEFRPEGKKIPRVVKKLLSERFGLHGEDTVITYFHRAKRKIQKYYKALNG